MKKSLLIGLASCILASFSFVACDDSNDEDYTLTPEEITSIINAFSGYHSGTMISSYDYDDMTNSFVYNDTSSVTITFTRDTIVTISNFPISILAKGLTSESTLKTILEEQGMSTASGKYIPAGVSPYAILINSISFPISYEGVEHTITLPLMGYYSFGQFIDYNQILYVQLVPTAIYLDDSLFQEFSASGGSVDLMYSFSASI